MRPRDKVYSKSLRAARLPRLDDLLTFVDDELRRHLEAEAGSTGTAAGTTLRPDKLVMKKARAVLHKLLVQSNGGVDKDVTGKGGGGSGGSGGSTGSGGRNDSGGGRGDDKDDDGDDDDDHHHDHDHDHDHDGDDGDEKRTPWCRPPAPATAP